MMGEKRKVTLKQVREEKGMKQVEVANRLKGMGRNIEQTHISLWERGAQTPKIDLAIDMAKAYGITFIELVRALGFNPDGDEGQDHDQN